MRRKGCIPRNAVQAVSIQAGLGWVVLGFGPLSHAEPAFQAGQWCSLCKVLLQAGELLAEGLSATGNS